MAITWVKETPTAIVIASQSDLPIIHFHMLPIEEKHSRWNITDVKIVRVNGSSVHIYQINSSHFTQVRRGLRKLQRERDMYVIIREAVKVSSVKTFYLNILFERNSWGENLS